MKDGLKIYAILVMTDLSYNKDLKFPDFGSECLVGYYSSKEAAFEAVKDNCCDIWETCYDYALIEEIEEGLYNPALPNQRWFFKYNAEKYCYEEIKEPEFVKHFCGFTFG